MLLGAGLGRLLGAVRLPLPEGVMGAVVLPGALESPEGAVGVSMLPLPEGAVGVSMLPGVLESLGTVMLPGLVVPSGVLSGWTRLPLPEGVISEGAALGVVDSDGAALGALGLLGVADAPPEQRELSGKFLHSSSMPWGDILISEGALVDCSATATLLVTASTRAVPNRVRYFAFIPRNLNGIPPPI